MTLHAFCIVRMSLPIVFVSFVSTNSAPPIRGSGWRRGAHAIFSLGLRRREACFLRAMTNVTKPHECYERIELAYMAACDSGHTPGFVKIAPITAMALSCS